MTSNSPYTFMESLLVTARVRVALAIQRPPPKHWENASKSLLSLCPNPSIERTCPGKPGHAAHVER